MAKRRRRIGEDMAGPVVRALTRTIREAVANAANAARRNKPAQWAYWLGVARELHSWYFDRPPLLPEHLTDGGIAGRALAMIQKADRGCPSAPPDQAALWWAQAIYARRLLRLWVRPVPRGRLDWLHGRAWEGRREEAQ